jgi:hypothetical protein
MRGIDRRMPQMARAVDRRFSALLVRAMVSGKSCSSLNAGIAIESKRGVVVIRKTIT